MKKILISMIWVLSLIAVCPAQERWTLEQCIDYALVHNLEIRNDDYASDIRKAASRGKAYALLPTVDASAGKDFGWTSGKHTKTAEISVNARIVLFHGGTMQYERLAAKEDFIASELTAQDTRNRICMDVTRSYLQILLAEQLLNYRKDNLVSSLKQRNHTEILVLAGSQPQSALSRMEAQVAEDRTSVIEAECDLRNCRLALSQLLDLPCGVLLATVEEELGETAPPPAVTPVMINGYTSRHERVLSSRHKVEMALNAHRAARTASMPEIVLTGGYGTHYDVSYEKPVSEQFKGNSYPYVGISISIPIFTGLQMYTRVKQSEIELRMAEIYAAGTVNSLQQEMERAVIEADNSYARYISSVENVKALEALLSVTEARYNAGAATALDYTIARSDLIKAVSDCMINKWQYVYQLRIIDMYKR